MTQTLLSNPSATSHLENSLEAEDKINFRLSARRTRRHIPPAATLPHGFTYNSSASGWYCDSITDRNGNAITIAHNSGGFVTSVTDPTSRALTFSYTSGKLTSVTDPLSRTWSFTYKSKNDPLRVGTRQ